MKKFFPAIAIVFCFLIGMCACNGGTMSESGPYQSLNSMMKASYSNVALTVTTSFGDDLFLQSEYVVTPTEGGKKISYTAERFALLDADAQEGSALKETLTGEAVYSEDLLLSQTGDAVSVPAVLGTGLTFKEEYFSNVTLGDVLFRADVKDAGAFTGMQLSCTDMKVSATFLEKFLEIFINFTDEDGYQVEYSFKFTA